MKQTALPPHCHQLTPCSPSQNSALLTPRIHMAPHCLQSDVPTPNMDSHSCDHQSCLSDFISPVPLCLSLGACPRYPDVSRYICVPQFLLLLNQAMSGGVSWAALIHPGVTRQGVVHGATVREEKRWELHSMSLRSQPDRKLTWTHATLPNSSQFPALLTGWGHGCSALTHCSFRPQMGSSHTERGPVHR